MRPLLVAIAAVLMIGSAGAVGQPQQPPGDAVPLPSFERVSIEPSTSGQIDVRFLPNGFIASTVTLSELIEQAYDLQPGEAVVGGPAWVRVDLVNVTATARQAVSRDRLQLMLQSLLADRFQLQLERGTRTGTFYRLKAPRARNLNPPARPNERPVVTTEQRDGTADFDALADHFDFRNATMSGLALALSRYVRAPVVDETNLTGRFDVRLHFRRHDAFGHGIDSTVPTFTRALWEQLGLALVADEGPVPVAAIRRVSRPFTN
jgi:uncharacterized protein (TIGR03435 family)